MKITEKKLLFIPLILASAFWQPGHHLLMHHGMMMNSIVHVLLTSIPFLTILLVLSRAEWDY